MQCHTDGRSLPNPKNVHPNRPDLCRAQLHTDTANDDRMPDVDPTPAINRQHIADLRRRTRKQCEHIIQMQRALCREQQKHSAEIHTKDGQLYELANQLMLLESRLKRRQAQIAVVLRQRDQTVRRQQKIIETLSNRLIDHGLGVSVMPDAMSAMPLCDAGCANAASADLDSLNDSDSAVVLDDIDLDWTSTAGSNSSGGGCMRRDSNGTLVGNGGIGASGECVSIVRSISDAIDTNYKASAAHAKRSGCFLRRPEQLETVYSVEEDHESTDQPASCHVRQTGHRQSGAGTGTPMRRCSFGTDAETSSIVSATSTSSYPGGCSGDGGGRESPERTTAVVVVRTSHYNRVMSSNHRSVTKPKDVKYRRINKVKSKSLEELCGQLKQTDSGGRVDSGTSKPLRLVHDSGGTGELRRPDPKQLYSLATQLCGGVARNHT